MWRELEDRSRRFVRDRSGVSGIGIAMLMFYLGLVAFIMMNMVSREYHVVVPSPPAAESAPAGALDDK